MTHSSEITIPLLLQTEKDEIEEGRKVDHIIDLNDLDNLSIKSWTISKVNVWLRESNSDAYTPKMVSIGPYHNKNPQLDSMEKYKKLYLRRFLQRKEGLDVKSCISELEQLKEKALECYDDMKDIDTTMLLLDGCFVVEFIRENCQKGVEKIININEAHIFRDLILLENQLPFFVLNKLFDMTKQDDELPLAILANDAFKYFGDRPKLTHASIIKEMECNAGNIKHLLHVVHKYSCHGNTMKKSNDDEPCQMPNATKLSEAGVRFAKNRNKKSLFDIKFENGSMTIPCLQVEDNTETILRNLIAYEQQSSDEHSKYFSDYALFMDQLINSDKDVNLLCQEEIIENWLGEDKEVASLFNKIGNGVSTNQDVFYYKEEFKKANKHCNRLWNRTKARLMHNYFSSPLVGASTVGGGILLILTTMQTILSLAGSFK